MLRCLGCSRLNMRQSASRKIKTIASHDGTSLNSKSVCSKCLHTVIVFVLMYTVLAGQCRNCKSGYYFPDNKAGGNVLAQDSFDYQQSVNIPSFASSIKKIPKVIYLTYYDRSCIPDKVWTNLRTHASGYDVIYFSDMGCMAFLEEYYGKKYALIFKNLSTGAHKADFFRYCILYRNGGVYLDIKIYPKMGFNHVFNHSLDNVMYTSLTTHDQIFQAIVATYPGNELFRDLIEDFFFLHPDYFKLREHHTENSPYNYNYFTLQFYQYVASRTKAKPKIGLNTYRDSNGDDQKIILFIERNRGFPHLGEKRDHIGGRYNVFSSKGLRLFKSRYSDFPWTTCIPPKDINTHRPKS